MNLHGKDMSKNDCICNLELERFRVKYYISVKYYF